MNNDDTTNLKNLEHFKAVWTSNWNSIDSGNINARLNLAHQFDEIGLHYFSQDHYLNLLENQSEIATEAAYGAVNNYVWFREYHAAKELLAHYSDLPDSLNTYVIESEAEYSMLGKNSGQIKFWVDQALKDRALVDLNFYQNKSLNNLKVKLSIEELLLNLAIDINQNPNALISNISVDVPISADSFVPRSLVNIVGSPVDRARDYLRTCAEVILKISESKERNLFTSSSFVEACICGKKVINKLFYLMSELEFSKDDVTVLENICWGLEHMQEGKHQFSGWILAGFIEEQVADKGVPAAKNNTQSDQKNETKGQSSIADEIGKIAELLQKGIIDDKEFKELKSKLIEKGIN